MQVAPVRVYGQTRNHYVDTYAVLDTAAGDCLCSAALLRLLGLTGRMRETLVTTATGTTELSKAAYLTLDIQGYRTSEVFSLPYKQKLKLT